MKKTIISAYLCFFVFFISACSTKYNYEDFKMGTVFTLSIYGKNPVSSYFLAKNSFKIIEELENKYSVSIESSFIYQLNQNGQLPVDDETIEVLNTGIEYSRMTEGAFDCTVFPLIQLWGFDTHAYRVPTQSEIDSALEKVGYENITVSSDNVILSNNGEIDLGGILKGYAVDRVVDYLKSKGVTAGIVNAGGNLTCFGNKPDGGKWNVGIRHPRNLSDIYEVLELAGDVSLATSGDYERSFIQDDELYHHILSAETGWPARNGVVSVTVLMSSAEACDALSTSLFAMGIDKGIKFADEYQIPALFIYESDGILYDTNSSLWLTN